MSRLELPQNALDRAMGTQATALQLRAERQALLAGNIANADTPGYRAKDFDFAQALKTALSEKQAAPTTPPSQAQPMLGSPQPKFDVRERAALQPSVDGNTVDLDTERADFADNALRYEFALRALNGQIKTLLAAIQG